ncbi:MAG: hypothetical protein JO270_04585 [Acidobacteriaceae bacterium]|nr:hypothetical protein [Acidobacteriaceae bacterium]
MRQDEESNVSGDSRESDNRREFLKKLGTALGGVALTGGGAVAPLFGQATPLPSGYKFYRVLTANDEQPYSGGVNPVGTLSAAVMLGAFQAEGKPQKDVIYFHGTTTPKAHTGSPQALFRAQVDYSSGKPQVIAVFIAVAEGDSLSQVAGVPSDQLPLVVGTLGIGSANSKAFYATTIAVNDYGTADNADYSIPLKSAPGVYLLDPVYGTWSNVARLGDPSPDGAQYGGFFGDVLLNEDNTVEMVAATTNPPAVAGLGAAADRSRVPWTTTTHALIHVSPGRHGHSYIVLKTGDRLPGTAAVVQSIGLIDAIHGELFVAQVNARRLDVVNALPTTAVVRGRLQPGGSAGPSDLALLTGSPGLFANGVPAHRDTLVGETFFGPRIGFDGLAAIVTHDSVSVPSGGSLDLQRLSTWGRRGRELIFRAGDLTANNATAVGDPVVSPTTGLAYVIRVLEDGTTELVVFNQAQEEKVILRSGDEVEGLATTEILHGYHPAQVDPAGRVAFAAEFLKDPKNPHAEGSVISCLVVGIPV